MTVIEDVPKLSKDEPLLKKYTMYALLISLLVAASMAVWFLIRYNKSNGYNIWWHWQIIHLVGYIAVGAFVCSALYGFFFGKQQFLLWYLYTVLALVIAEGLCVIVNKFIGKEEKEYDIFVALIKVAVLIWFGISAALVFCWRRMMTKKTSGTAAAPEAPEKAEKVVNKEVKEPETKGSKAGAALIKSDQKKNKN